MAAVYLQCGSGCSAEGPCKNICYDPTILGVYQDPSIEQLNYVSWSRSQNALPDRYYFDESAGEDVPVYVIDTGATLDHVVSKWLVDSASTQKR